MNIDRNEILKLYEGLRVTDVNDGMDAVGLQDVGCVSDTIRTLWRDTESFSHKICGFAYTLRYIPTQRRIAEKSIEEYQKVKDHWYSKLANPYPGLKNMRKGDILVIDGAGLGDTGFIGSANILAFMSMGASGVVTNGRCRDTDEIIRQKCPVYSAGIGRGIRPGRIEYDACEIPINLGGVLVRPGDLIVADGDGVLVVPIEKCREVAGYARVIAEGDKKSRGEMFDKLGMERDFTT